MTRSASPAWDSRWLSSASRTPSHQQMVNISVQVFVLPFCPPMLLEIPVTPRLNCFHVSHCHLITCIRSLSVASPTSATGLPVGVDQKLHPYISVVSPLRYYPSIIRTIPSPVLSSSHNLEISRHHDRSSHLVSSTGSRVLSGTETLRQLSDYHKKKEFAKSLNLGYL